MNLKRLSSSKVDDTIDKITKTIPLNKMHTVKSATDTYKKLNICTIGDGDNPEGCYFEMEE